MRAEFRGPLTYSANFDTWQGIGFWDALDFVGVSAYFPLSDHADPPLAELEAGWERALAPLAAAARRWRRPVLLTEAGFPSIPNAARAPWREERVAADVWLQARCYEATLRALARQPAVEGVFFWLWERTSRPAVPRRLARDRRQAGELRDDAALSWGCGPELQERGIGLDRPPEALDAPEPPVGITSNEVVSSMSGRIECQTEQYFARRAGSRAPRGPPGPRPRA